MGFTERCDRRKQFFLPPCLDDYVAEDSPVRVVDMFVDELDLGELGFPLSSRNIEDLLFKRGIDFCHKTVRLWWHSFGPLFAGEVRRQWVLIASPISR